MAARSALVHEKRIHQVQSWILQDIPSDMIVRQIIQLDWCKERQARVYLKDASERWAKAASNDIETKKRIKIAELQERKRSLKEEFRGTPGGMKILNDIDKMIIALDGLNTPVEVNLNYRTQELMKPEVTFVVKDSKILEYRKNEMLAN